MAVIVAIGSESVRTDHKSCASGLIIPASLLTEEANKQHSLAIASC